MSFALLEPRRKIRKICCIGAGYVGGPTCAVIANRVPDVVCRVVDLNEERIAAWNSDRLPVYEPGLEEMVNSCVNDYSSRKANLVFTTAVDEAIQWADLIFVSVNTPTKLKGEGAGRALDLTYVEAATRRIAEVSDEDKIVVEKSTVPCQTAESIRDVLSQNSKPGVSFDVLSNPEFLAEGTAIENLLHPDRILIGSTPDIRGRQAAAALAEIYTQWISVDKIITMNSWSSELAKLAANAMLAQRISSMNTLSAICEATGAEIDQVSFAVGLDSRIGPKMLKSSVGFGGSCFKKDVLSLVYLAESLHLDQVASYWKSVIDINEWQKDRFAKRIVACMYNTLQNKKIAILGFAYKKNTGDARESAAITVIHDLIAERAEITIYDPQVREGHIWQELLAVEHCDEQGLKECVTVCSSAYEACRDAHAVVIMTEWDLFRVDSEDGDNDGNVKENGGARLVEATAEVDTAVEKVNGWEEAEVGAAAVAAGKETATNTEAGEGAINGFVNGDQSHLRSNSSEKKPVSDGKEARLDWSRISQTMMKPMFVFDGRNIVSPARLEALGFRVECIGSSMAHHRPPSH